MAKRNIMNAEDQQKEKYYQSEYQRYQQEGNQEGMDWAHNNAETLRNKYGYSGGSDGSQKTPLGYTSKHADQINASIEKLTNQQPFTYDYTKDPLYQQYEQAYRREGERAFENAIGEYAAMTGGLPSSWAVSAASQAQNYYNQQLADKIPELQQLAYQMYQDQIANERNNLYDVLAVDANDLNIWGANSNLINYLDETEYNRNYQAQRDAITDARYDRAELAQNKQNEINNALSIMESIGYVPENLAGVLGIDPGTQTLGGRQVDWGQNMDQISTAMALSELFGYAPDRAAGILGIDPGAQTLGGREFDFNSDMARRELALQALRARNSSSGSGGGNDNSSKTKFSSSEIEVAEENILNGQADDWTMSALRQKFPNMTDEQIFQYYGVNEAGNENVDGTISNQTDEAQTDWIYVPGFGRLSFNELEKKIDNGEIIENYDPKTRTYTYTKKK